MKIPHAVTNPPMYAVIGTAAVAFLIAIILALLSMQGESTPAPVSTPELFPAPLTLSTSKITARAAIVYDPRNGRVLFAKNEEEPLPLASLTKLMTAQTVLTLKNEDESVTIGIRDLSPEGDWGLIPGTTWRLGDLLAFGLVASANDAMAAAAAASSGRFIDEMNRAAGDLGLTQTYFLNPTGLDVDPETAGAYGSAYDVARLAAAFLKEYPALFETTSRPSIEINSEYSSLHASSTDTPLLDIPGLIAAKTGYTELAGGNLVAVFDVEIGHPLVVAVLGSTREQRFEDIRTLISATRKNNL
jgi:D-alanyl-D-alanine carboxypeptidase